jgi:acetyl-CoA carboxylase carboxyltransferase component
MAGIVEVGAPMQGTVVSVVVAVGDTVRAGQPVVILESMKLEHVVEAEQSGIVRTILVAEGETVMDGQVMVTIDQVAVAVATETAVEAVDPDRIRPDLAEVLERHRVGLDDRRPESVARRRKVGRRTTRENVADLVDADTFVEYGPMVIAAQRRRRTMEDLIAKTPADGLVGGIGSINGDTFPGHASKCVVASYDYTVLAGTQGSQNHRKKDRLFELAETLRLPVVIFTEGGGGRPGDTDGLGTIGLECMAFHLFARLSGAVPIVAINSGYCFAGNAALLGCADVVIAAKDSNIGMGGPAMIEGGGLGVYEPTEVGPMSVQVPNGVVDIEVEDEAEAVAMAKKYLSYFQGPIAEWSCTDQRLLRSAIPENRLRSYDVRKVIDLMFDTDSVLELRPRFGVGMITALARLEGRPVGVIANNPNHLAGAIDSDNADKGARFLQLCDAFDIPIVSLIDTPGMMVGPEVERTALVRHCSRMFVVGANITVPMVSIVLRKCYGLGAQTMAAGSLKAPLLTVAWPTGEFGGMGLEGAVRLGYRNELDQAATPEARDELFRQLVDRLYEHGKALSTATTFEIDDVIDPAESRAIVKRSLDAVPPPAPRSHKKRPNIDTW